MKLSNYILKYLARKEHKKVKTDAGKAIELQQKTFKKIINLGSNSLFAKTKKIDSKVNYDKFKRLVAVSGYESFRPFVEKISKGNPNVLTKEKVLYFAATSGTTSGSKYIPLTSRMMNHQTSAIKSLLLLYAHQTGQYSFINSKMMFIQGSPSLSYYNCIPFGKLSGISALHVPFYLKKNRLPSMETNLIKPWSKKIEAIVKETKNENLEIIGGIPPWVITYFNALLKQTKRSSVKSVFKNLSLYIHGGTDFSVYKKLFFNLCGEINTLEVFPASEGFFAYQNVLNEPDLLLLVNSGVFYEFIELCDYNKNILNRVPLADVRININYVMIVSTVAGLWGYNTGDTVRFTSTSPYKILFSGRASQYCSTFGEHVIEKEVSSAINSAINKFGGSVREYTVCPKLLDGPGRSHHEWFVEFDNKPNNMSGFSSHINLIMKKQNIYYKDLIESGVIGSHKIHIVHSGGFVEYMKSIGKFGGQNKCPHLSNTREVGDFLYEKYVEKK